MYVLLLLLLIFCIYAFFSPPPFFSSSSSIYVRLLSPLQFPFLHLFCYVALPPPPIPTPLLIITYSQFFLLFPLFSLLFHPSPFISPFTVLLPHLPSPPTAPRLQLFMFPSIIILIALKDRQSRPPPSLYVWYVSELTSYTTLHRKRFQHYKSLVALSLTKTHKGRV